MSLGSGIGIGKVTRVVGIDADAQVYFDALIAQGFDEAASQSVYGLAQSVVFDEFNSYVVEGKSSGWWDEWIADYPIIGGTDARHSINAKNPGTFNGTFINTEAGDHTATGIQFDGINEYMETGIIASTSLTDEDVTMGVYSRSDNPVPSQWIDLSANNGVNTLQLFIEWSTGDFFWYAQNSGTGAIDEPNPTSTGGHHGSRVSTTDTRIFRNGSQIGATGVTSGGTMPAIEIFFGARNLSGVADRFSARSYAGAVIGGGLTPSQVLSHYTAWQSLQTLLGRQV